LLDSISPLGPIPEDWSLAKLKDITTKIGSGATPRGGESVYLPEREFFALVRSQNVFDHYFDDGNLAYISDEHSQQLASVWLQSGDLLLNITGDGITFGRVCIVPEYILPACVNQHVTIIRVDPSKCVPGYLLAYLTLPKVKEYIESFNAGGSRRAITKGHIESFEIPLPSLAQQKAIHDLVIAFNDKIEANRRMNETLEATARAIFRSWFVDFDPVHYKSRGEQPPGMDGETAALFPDNFEEGKLELIPRGYQSGKIANMARFEHNIINPAIQGDEIFYHYSLPAYDEGKMPKLEHGWEIKSNKHLLPNGCVLLSKLNPQNMKVWIPIFYDDGRAISSTEFLVMMAQTGFSIEYLYSLFTTVEFSRIFSNLVTGTSSSHQRVKPNYLLDMDVLLPPHAIVERFTALVKPIYQQVLSNQDQSRRLAETRDALLPKLVSGDLRVNEVEDMEV
jgi:type I restriction enzyme S subunit